MSEQQLKLKRGALKGQLTRFANFLNEITESTDINELVARLKKIEPILETFESVQIEIELICEEVQDTERTTFEDLYFQMISKAKNVISNQNGEHSVSSVPDNSGSDILDVHSKVKLPPIKLPEFFGSYEQWMTFADIFTSLVHENQSLNNAQKFVYLRNCVRGDAAQLINSLEMTNANYPKAWDILQERYANKKLIVHCHIKNIFELMPIKFESYTHLRSLLDTFNKNLRTLAALEQPTEQWNTLLVYIVSSKLDTNTKKEWEKCTAEIDFPTVNQLTDFLSKRCNLLETIDNRNKQTKTNNKEKVLTHISTTTYCAFCKGNHLNFDCDKIKNMVRSELHAEVKKHRLCLNYLRPFHSHDKCKSPGCKHCGRKHNTLLHIPKNDTLAEPKKVAAVDMPNALNTNKENLEQTINLHCSSKTTQVLLATVQLDVLNNNGVPVRARAILDSGSQTSFMTKGLANKLNLPFIETSTPVASINSTLNKINTKVSTDIQSLQENYCKNETFLIIDNITERLSQITFDISKLDIPANIRLADNDCHLTNPVDILLGAGIFFESLSVGQIKLGPDKPILQKTKFGWILSGTLIVSNETPTFLCNFVTSDNGLNMQLEQFWKLEEASRNIVYSKEEQECEEYFAKNYKRNDQGRFQVALPLKDNYIKLGESETQAISRFHKLEKRFHQDTNFKSEYCKFMSEYEQLGHMTRIEADMLKQDCLNYYLPHHGVIKESSTTTKLRVVYDASAKTTAGLSLNDVLKTGPLIQRDLFSIVLKFRRHNVVFIGDIEKMYRQVDILPSERDLQRIVWRDSPERELSHYRLNTVTYGTSPAPFLATRCLQQAAFDNLDSFPEASDAIINDFYMDDILSGHDTVQDAIRLKNEITNILHQSGFVLRKFRSNHQSVVEDDMQTIEGEYQMFKDEKCKTLGLLWNTTLDIFCYSVHMSELKVVTKRTILSTIARIFDPLGLIAPITIVAKLILQKLWQSNSDWDKSVSMELYTTWNKFFKNL
nr:unnamed protein product [Callosobruchus analis]